MVTKKKKPAKRRVKKSTKPPTLRQILDFIDTQLAAGDDTSRQLWDVLTALRGPDDFSHIEKVAKTIPIRRAAFPKTAGDHDHASANGAFFGSPADKEVRMDGFGLSHFAGHIRAAAVALGILKPLTPVAVTE